MGKQDYFILGLFKLEASRMGKKMSTLMSISNSTYSTCPYLVGRMEGELVCWSCLCSVFLPRRLNESCKIFLLNLQLTREGFM